jgi:arabinogalactan oligomer/maltooligosaccharide transport system substrate-binding protein
MNTKIRFVSLLAGAAIFAAACGGGAATPSPTEAPAESMAPESMAPESMAPESPAAVTCPDGEYNLAIWTKEGDPSLAYVQAVADAYTAAHPNVTFEITNKDVELLREDFQTASLAGDAPEILWTVSDHIGPFTAADLITPLDDMIDTASYDPTALSFVQVDGVTWAAPITFGNQLMLYWDKSKVGETAPADSDAMIAKAVELTSGDNYGLVFNNTEPFWLVPFLGGFGGQVFAEDGVTPTLDTDAMQNSLKLMYDLKYTDKVMPLDSNYDVADGAFKTGLSPMIINGDWAMADYQTVLGENLAVGPIPMLTGYDYPKPYIAGSFWMASSAVGQDEGLKCVVGDFFKWSTAKDEQLNMVKTLKRLPANAAALADPIVTGDPLLAGAAEAAKKGVPQPTNLEMRCVWDSMKPGLADVIAGNNDFAAVTATMQSSAETCISQQ